MRNPSQPRGKRGWLCSKECRGNRRLRLYGNRCQVCDGLYCKHPSAKDRGFCSLACSKKSTTEANSHACEGCQSVITSNRFCSKGCHAEWKRREVSRSCLFCSKTFYRRSLSRKQPKPGSSVVMHNAFCSKKCAKKFTAYEAARKARCKCGMKTGAIETTCLNCKKRRAWERWCFNESNKTYGFGHVEKTWHEKLCSMINANRYREPKIQTKKTKKTRIVTWDQSCKTMKTTLRRKTKVKQWDKKIHNWLTNSRKRMNRKAVRLRSKVCEN
jgi:hypothetical protein